ncbi:unnamed protein product, partial [Meganyctiphanes norvegica]
MADPEDPDLPEVQGEDVVVHIVIVQLHPQLHVEVDVELPLNQLLQLHWRTLVVVTDEMLHWLSYNEEFWANIRLPVGRNYFSNCQVNNCFLTYNRKQFNYSQLDAIIWDNVFTKDVSKPEQRYPYTRYILANREGPARYGKLRFLNILFNWTMTYRLDSEVPFSESYIY